MGIGINAATWGIAGLATFGVISRPWNFPEFIWAAAGAALVAASAGAFNQAIERRTALQQGLVRGRCGKSGTFFHNHFVPGFRQPAHAFRNEGDARLSGDQFLENGDAVPVPPELEQHRFGVLTELGGGPGAVPRHPASTERPGRSTHPPSNVILRDHASAGSGRNA